jgi:hypothetical protein
LYLVGYIHNFMQGIHNSISETNYDSQEYHVAANLWLKFMADLRVILFPVTQYFYRYISTFVIIHFIIIISIIFIIIVIIALSALIKISPISTVSSLPAKLTTVFQVS